MDSVTMVTAIRDAVGAGVMSPNEGRAKFDLKPVEGGASPYLQQQNYSLSALAKRDAQADPFAPKTPPAPKPAPADAAPADGQGDQQDQPKPPPAKVLPLEERFALALRAVESEAA
jgi:phage portal protein BeeE